MAKYKHVIFNSLSQLDFYQTVALPWQKLNWLGKLTVKAYVYLPEVSKLFTTKGQESNLI